MKIEIQSLAKVYIVIDALDECAEESGVRADLVGALKALPETVNLLVTSRHVASVAQILEGSKRLDVKASGGDVREYIRMRTRREQRLQRHVSMDPLLQRDIIQRVSQNCQGMLVLSVHLLATLI